VISRAGPERLDDLEPLWHALAVHHGSVTPELAPLRERADSWARRRAHYEERLAQPGAFLLIAEADDGSPVGYAMVSTGAASQTWAIEAAATLETIVLLPEARGKGLGTALIARVREEVRAAGVTHLLLSVVADNAAAIRFYRRHGFESAFIEMIARP